MRHRILYLLMSLFLLFTVENRNYVDFQTYSFSDIFSALSLSKKHHQNQKLEKSNSGHSQDSGSVKVETEEDLLPSSQAVAAVCTAVIFGFSCMLALWSRRKTRLISYPYIYGIFSVKKFILMRSIRI